MRHGVRRTPLLFVQSVGACLRALVELRRIGRRGLQQTLLANLATDGVPRLLGESGVRRAGVFVRRAR